MSNAHTGLLVLVSSAVTWALRALPFAALAPLRHSAIVRYLSLHMPVGVMAMLSIYALHMATTSTPRQVGWLIISVVVTVGAQLWRQQAVLSIVLGTACYATLMSALS